MTGRGCALVVAALLAAAAPAQAGEPTGDGLGNMQELELAAYPPVAGAPIIFDFQQTYWNLLGVRPRAPREVVIRFPRGGKWNGPLFPKCDPVRLAASGPRICPRGSKFATARARVALGASQTNTIEAAITDFVGPRRHGHPTQLLYVRPSVGAPVLITAEVISEPRGPYDLALHVDLTPLNGAVVIVWIRNVDLHRTIVRHHRRVPLIVAPPTCTGRWHYALESVFDSGSPLVSTTTQPCVARRSR